MKLTELMQQVPQGSSKVFQPTLLSEAPPARFFSVFQSWDYKPGRFAWKNEEYTGLESRTLERRSIKDIAKPLTVFEGPSTDVVDFYSSSRRVVFISETLLKLFEKLDPGSLEYVEINLITDDTIFPFYAAMPKRVLEAIDASRTKISIVDKDYGGTYFRYVDCPDWYHLRSCSYAGRDELLRYRYGGLVLV